MTTLNELFPKVASGGLVIFDDFFIDEDPNEGFPGARLAVKEFFGDRYKDLKKSIGGTYYYVKK